MSRDEQPRLFVDPPTCKACKATRKDDCKWEVDNRHLPAFHRDRKPRTCLHPRYDPATAALPDGY